MTKKEANIKLKLSPYIDKKVSTDFVVWSKDYQSYVFTFEFEDECGNPFLLMESKQRILLMFEDGTEQLYNLDVYSKRLGIATFTIPKPILGYEGRVKANIYVYNAEGTHDMGGFNFVMKQSDIDGEKPQLDFYIQDIDEGLKRIEEAEKEVKNINNGLQEQVNAIEKKIEDNDIVTKKEIGEVDVLSFGAKGDSYTDDTKSINDAIKYAKKNGIKKVTIKNGIYLIKAHVDNQAEGNYLRDQGGVEMLSDITLEIGYGAVLKAIPNNKKAYNIIRAHRKSNWEIVLNGEIIGDNDVHIGSEGEWGYGISIQGGSDFKIKGGGLIANCWGDGINLQRAVRIGNEETGYYPENGVISGITLDKNGRQGMSIEEGKNIYVRDAIFSNTKRIVPEYGICVEPAWRNKEDAPVCEDITIDNCKILGNKGGGITTVGTTIDDNIQLKRIVVKNCYFEDNGENTTLKTSCAISANRSDILIKDCIFKTNQSIYVSSCRYVDIFDLDMLNGTIMILSDKTHKYNIRTTLNIFNNKIRIMNSKTNSYSSVIFTAIQGDIANIVDNNIFYNDTNAVIIKNTGDSGSGTKEVFCLGNRLVGGSISIQHQFIDVYRAFDNTIIKSDSQAFNSNGYEVYFKNNNIVDCKKGIFIFCNNDQESYYEVSNNNFDVKDKFVLSNYQANKLFTLFNLDNKISKNIQFMDAANGNPLSEESIVDLHIPKIVTLKNQDKSQNVPIGTMFLDLNTGWIMYKSYNGLHRVTTTKI